MLLATTFCTFVREFSPRERYECLSVYGVPDEYPIKLVFDGA